MKWFECVAFFVLGTTVAVVYFYLYSGHANVPMPAIEHHETEEESVVRRCGEAGGFVVRSAWDSRIIECKPINPCGDTK